MTEKDATVQELCDYLNWAYYNSIDLDGDEQTVKDYETVRSSTCATLSNNTSAVIVDFD